MFRRIPYPVNEQDQQQRARRVLQISGLSALGLLLAAVVADPRIVHYIVVGIGVLVVVAWFAWKQRLTIAVNLFLWAMTLFLSALAWLSEGVRDMALMAYPAVLIFSAILGGRSLFFPLLSFMILFATVVGFMTLYGFHEAYYYELGFRHIVFADVILAMTGFSAYILIRDQRRLMISLHEENRRVKENENLIGALANVDQLTGLANRRYLEAEFEHRFKICRRQKSCLAMLFFDLDNFKPVNDSLGHAAGDTLLRQMAERMNKLIGEDDVLCRFGGDEFLLLTAFNPGEEKRINQVAQALIDAATRPFFIMDTLIEVSASVGVAFAPQHGTSFSELCQHADLAMYQAKDDGRHIFRIYDDSMKRLSKEKLNMMASLRDALKNREFTVQYQPQIRLGNGSVCGAEALIRWRLGSGAFVSPADFIPLAESTGIIVDIGYWVLRESCIACAQWRSQGHQDMTVSVNLSYVQFRDGDLPGKVKTVLNETGLPPSALELELTESMLIGESVHVQRQMDELHQLGVRFAIDDFGTGYSNLGYLQRFNASRLKVDKSFVSDLGHSDRDRPLVRAIIQMADSLDMQVVAEGVEDELTLQQLQQMGCHEAQGYYWSPARVSQEFIHWIEEHNSAPRED